MVVIIFSDKTSDIRLIDSMNVHPELKASFTYFCLVDSSRRDLLHIIHTGVLFMTPATCADWDQGSSLLGALDCCLPDPSPGSSCDPSTGEPSVAVTSPGHQSLTKSWSRLGLWFPLRLAWRNISFFLSLQDKLSVLCQSRLSRACA